MGWQQEFAAKGFRWSELGREGKIARQRRLDKADKQGRNGRRKPAEKRKKEAGDIGCNIKE